MKLKAILVMALMLMSVLAMMPGPAVAEEPVPGPDPLAVVVVQAYVSSGVPGPVWMAKYVQLNANIVQGQMNHNFAKVELVWSETRDPPHMAYTVNMLSRYEHQHTPLVYPCPLVAAVSVDTYEEQKVEICNMHFNLWGLGKWDGTLIASGQITRYSNGVIFVGLGVSMELIETVNPGILALATLRFQEKVGLAVTIPKYLEPVAVLGYMQENPDKITDNVGIYIDGLDASAFKKPAGPRQGALLNKLDVVAAHYEVGDFDAARNKIWNDIWPKMDGDVVVEYPDIKGDPSNDWIVDGDVQGIIDSNLNMLVYSTGTPDFDGIMVSHMMHDGLLPGGT